VRGLAVDKAGALCGGCHSDVKDAASAARSTHEPVVAGECTACHSPHQTALEGLLLAKTPDLCLTCHKALKTRMAEERVHPPAARDCLRCHQPHSSAEPRLMLQPARTLCAGCHDPGEAAFGAAHLEIDAGQMRCERCHDPHASKEAAFFKNNVHAPFGSKDCQECHLAPRARTR
jgi:predicted CXXCH cytochrome family protein